MFIHEMDFFFKCIALFQIPALYACNVNLSFNFFEASPKEVLYLNALPC